MPPSKGGFPSYDFRRYVNEGNLPFEGSTLARARGRDVIIVLMQPLFTIGIDEAGRGPLAGPVSIGLVKVHKSHEKKIKNFLKTIRGKDSKKLTHTERELWFEKMKVWQKEGMIDFHVALVSHTHIDKKGISHAIKHGIAQCLKKVNVMIEKEDKHENYFIKLDGSLSAPVDFKNQKTIIKGDEKEWIIGLASIAAKVTRDRYMARISPKYPLYAFDIHKGYGTAMHRKTLKIHGISAIHRKSFLKNII